MRLIRCYVENLRVHKQLSIDFKPGINIIFGENESGKSSFIEGVHKGLFLKANSTGSTIEKLQSNLYPGNPIVEINFEARNELWVLRKKFSGQSGTTILEGSISGHRKGLDAEELLSELLGIEEILGSRKANKYLSRRWSHLWSNQGDSMINFIEQGPDFYEFNTLTKKLEESAESALQSPADNYVSTELERLINQTITSKGVKKNSLLWQLNKDVENSVEENEKARIDLKAFEDSSYLLEKYLTNLKELKDVKIPGLKSQIENNERNVQVHHELKQQIKNCQKLLVPISKDKDELEKTLMVVINLQEEAKLIQHKITENQINIDLENNKVSLYTQAIDQTEKILETERKCLTDVEQKGQLIKVIDEINTLRLQQNIQKDEIRDQKLMIKQYESNLTKLNSLPDINKDEISLLRDLGENIRNQKHKSDASSTQITVNRKDKDITLDGNKLHIGQTKTVSQKSLIEIGPNIQITIQPGNIKDLDNISKSLTRNQNELSERLKKYSINSIKEAEEIFINRTMLIDKIEFFSRKINKKNGENKNNLNIQEILESTTKRIGILGQEIEEFNQEVKNEVYRELNCRSSEKNNDDMKHLLLKYRQIYKKTNERIKTNINLLNSNKKLLNHSIEKTYKLKTNLEVFKTELKSKKIILQQLMSEHVSEEQIQGKIKDLAKEIYNKKTNIKALEIKYNSYEVKINPNLLQKLKLQYTQSLDELSELSKNCGVLRERCEGLGYQELHRRMDETNEKVKVCKYEQEEEVLILEARQELLNSFRNAQSLLSNRYTIPLSKSINSFLRPLMNSNEDGCNMNFVPIKGYKDIAIRRNGQSYQFNELSGGMKEQLNAALRLSIADVLKSSFNGTLPMIFDDSFTNTDMKRLIIINNMLKIAKQRGLQIILLTCKINSYEEIADNIIRI